MREIDEVISAYSDPRDAEPLLCLYKGETLGDPREISGDGLIRIKNPEAFLDPRIAGSSTSTPYFLSSPLNALKWLSENNDLHASSVGIIGSKELPAVADANWQIVGTGDLDGDGNVGVLSRHGVTGRNAARFMSGTAIIGSTEFPAVAAVSWQIVGTGDFNGDGKADILWRHATTGQNVIKLMDASTIIGSAELSALAGPLWEIVGTGDFDGDRKADVLWRHLATRQNVVWIMNEAK
jgi:hypothetical protein